MKKRIRLASKLSQICNRRSVHTEGPMTIEGTWDMDLFLLDLEDIRSHQMSFELPFSPPAICAVRAHIVQARVVRDAIMHWRLFEVILTTASKSDFATLWLDLCLSAPKIGMVVNADYAAYWATGKSIIIDGAYEPFASYSTTIAPRNI